MCPEPEPGTSGSTASRVAAGALGWSDLDKPLQLQAFEEETGLYTPVTAEGIEFELFSPKDIIKEVEIMSILVL